MVAVQPPTIYLDAIVLGQPLPQTRPRVYRNGGVAADSPKLAAWKAQIVAAIVDAGWTPPPADAPLHLTLEFAMPVAERCRHGRPATTRPDLDNLAKAAADALMAPTARAFISALRKVRGERYEGVIADDARIVSMALSKRWAPRPGGVRIVLADAAGDEQFSSMSR